MDRPRRRSRLLIAATAAGLGLAAARADVAAPPLRAQRWLAPGADAAAILTRRPVECLRLPADPETAYRVEVGRAAFRGPLLLGGQAARAGVACETCHRSGRTNPDFAFPGVSGAPGTADVTSFVFSSHRGDSLFDPRPIPDLGGPKSGLKVSQAPGSPALKTFIRGLVTEEFDGHEPPERVLEGLAAYVRALDPAACAPAAFEPVTAVQALADVRRAVAAAQGALARHDPETAVAMVQAARSELGDVAERYAGPRLAAQRRALATAGQDLADIASGIRRSDPGAADRLSGWLTGVAVWAPGILRAQSLSLYDRRRWPSQR